MAVAVTPAPQVLAPVQRAAHSPHPRSLHRSPPDTRHRGVAHASRTTCATAHLEVTPRVARPALAGPRCGARAADAPRTARVTPPCHAHTRRALLLMTAASSLLTRPAYAKARRGASPELQRAFEQAMQAMEQGDYDAAEAAWSRCIELSPELSASWSNRGTMRLQRGQWADAAHDLEQALALETEQVGAENANALVRNNLGNCKGALGDWDGAMMEYLAAAKDVSMKDIAMANYALALFQTGQDQAAIKEAKQLLRRDPQFWDMRAASVAFLWGTGDEAGAESEYETLKELGGGLGAAMYSGTERVKARWPPRCTAALEAFFKLERNATALDYDGERKQFSFE